MIIKIADWKEAQVKNPPKALRVEKKEQGYFEGKSFAEFLDWRFCDAIYEQYGMLITTNGEQKVKMFHDDTSNIPSWDITIGDYTDERTQTFLTEEDAYLEWIRLEELEVLEWDIPTTDYVDTSNFSRDFKWERPLVFNIKAITYNEYKKAFGITYNHPKDKDYMMCNTEESWYPAYEGGYVQAAFRKHNSNIPMWNIHLGGNDDYSISQDFLDEAEALAKWEEILQAKVVNKDILGDNYFSN